MYPIAFAWVESIAEFHFRSFQLIQTPSFKLHLFIVVSFYGFHVPTRFHLINVVKSQGDMTQDYLPPLIISKLPTLPLPLTQAVSSNNNIYVQKQNTKIRPKFEYRSAARFHNPNQFTIKHKSRQPLTYVFAEDKKKKRTTKRNEEIVQ